MSSTTKKTKTSSKTAPPPAAGEKNKKPATISSAPTSPWVDERSKETDPALPWAGGERAKAQLQNLEPEKGSPCPSSQRHSPSMAPRVSRVPQAQFVANTGTGFTSPWVAPPTGNITAGTAQQQWNFPADARGQYTNMAPPMYPFYGGMNPFMFGQYGQPLTAHWPQNQRQQYPAASPASSLALPNPVAWESGVIDQVSHDVSAANSDAADRFITDTDGASASGTSGSDSHGFRNPHCKSIGTPVTDKVLSWWEQLRTNKLGHEEIKEELSNNLIPTEQEKFFKAPELPSQVKSSFKEARSSLVSQDDRLKDSHGHVLKSALPLVHLFDALADPLCPDAIDATMVKEHVTSALILLGSASQSLAVARQHAFDDLLDKRFDSLKKKAPSMDFFFGGNLVKDIEEAEKANKLASKVVKGTSGSTSLSSKKSRFSPYSSAVARKFRGGRTFRGGRSFNNSTSYGNGRSSWSTRSNTFKGNRNADDKSKK
ncbi:uncharacterized protein [Asterias amurensis]|uniref:uncharacterized protein n=2 Tax=Asterias amurensis TaxID=7602 RepID=UPI003AB1C68C